LVIEEYPLLFKILKNWKEEPERPPLLLNGLEEKSWNSVKKDIIEIFTQSSKTSLVSAESTASHSDILILERNPEKNTIEIDQVREFINQMSLSELELPFKIGLIPTAHHLNHQSQNALLKTLEEPLKNRYLILGTTAKSKLLPTVLSRVTVINMDRRPEETGPTDSVSPARLAETDGRTFLEIAPALDRKRTDEPSLKKEIMNFYDNCLKSSPHQRLQISREWSGGKTEKIVDFFEFVIPELHYKLISATKDGNVKDAWSLTGQLKKALSCSEQLGRTSGANPKLMFEAFLLNLN